MTTMTVGRLIKELQKFPRSRHIDVYCGLIGTKVIGGELDTKYPVIPSGRKVAVLNVRLYAPRLPEYTY